MGLVCCKFKRKDKNNLSKILIANNLLLYENEDYINNIFIDDNNKNCNINLQISDV